MAEYIERKKLVNSLKMWLMDLENDMDKGDYGELSENKGAREALESCICEIEEQPAADVQPVIHAKWVLFDKDCVGRAFYCSNCRKVTTTDDFEDTPLDRDEYFCMRCGADMREPEAIKG